jgi:hypothetical protein
MVKTIFLRMATHVGAGPVGRSYSAAADVLDRAIPLVLLTVIIISSAMIATGAIQ